MTTRRGAMLHADPHAATVAAAATTTADAPGVAARVIQQGDLVVVVEGFNAATSVRIRSKGTYKSRFGTFHHDDWVGETFGHRARARDGRGFVWLLAPTPELWTKVLEHRTQILYAPDIALVCAEMELKPGSVVCESGTGSGSLTHALARCVAPTGSVWTYEFNETRVNAAKKEFEANGLGEFVTVTHRDIERDGFPEEMAGCADAVFLDLPGPYKCVTSVARTLRPDGVMCSFSPCIEQVQKTIIEMEKNGFGGVKTVELLGREYDVEGRKLQTDLTTPLAKSTKYGWRKDFKRPREGANATEANEENAAMPSSTETETIVTFPRQRLQSHTAYLTFARLLPVPDGWEELAAKRSKTLISSEDLLVRAQDFLAKRKLQSDRPPSRAAVEPRPNTNVIENPGDYSE
jgi:tRNA (adenine57-N1/adenine58-N1)-methyltransferase